MDFYRKVRAQQDQVDDGTLKVSVFTEDGTRPVENALVRISYTGESGQMWMKYGRIRPGRHRYWI